MKLFIVPKLKSTTVRNYIDGFERGAEYLANEKIAKIQDAQIMQMIHLLEQEGYARSSVAHTFSVYKNLFEKAFKSHIIPADPFTDLTYSIEKPGTIHERL